MRGRKKTDPEKLRKAVALYQGGFPIQKVTDISGLPKSTIYRELDRLGIPRHNDKRA